MRAVTVSTLALLTTACASAPRSSEPGAAPATPAGVAASPAADAPSGTAIKIPPRVATLRLGGRQDYEDRALGVRLRYVGSDSVYADVYVYPGPGFDARCDSQCAAQVFAREVAQFQADFPEMIKLQYYQSIVVVEDEKLPPGPDGAWRLGQHLRLGVTRDGKPGRSDFYLYYLPRYKVKVRITYNPTPERTQALDAFMRDLLPQLVGVPANPPPP